ncbi:MAG TPA: S46 family peptidase [Cryomorphaceae bacterium]|nr:S46 family peptidase [Cryomorphaceae bacterium]
MKRSILTLLILAFIATSPTKADEGMWLPMLIKRLQQRDLQEMGLQLTPEEIYSVNNSSLKDAIVSMGGGFCTGEIISDNGLMLTNHHCGYDAIRENSTVENDYLTDGFWAMSYDEEKPNPGLYVSFLVRMEDVTADVLSAIEGAESETERNAAISEISKSLAEKAEEGTHYKAQVKSFYAGNEFYLFVYESFPDVRLVGAPPSSVGKFGGDTDNWMWPRHTGDFTLFRVYSGPDGMPAEYSEENIPLKPKHSLPISLSGVEEGDFTMTFGYPGSTDRYLTSFGIEQAISKKNPAVVEIRDAKLKVLKADMKESDAVRLQYASKYASIANYWKYFIGQTEQLKALDVKGEKERLEKDFRTWAGKNPNRAEKFGNALKLIEDAYKQTDNTIISSTYVVEAGIIGADAILYAYRTNRELQAFLEMEEGEKKAQMKEDILARAKEHFDGINIPTDKKLFAVTQKMYYNNVPKEQQPEYLRENGDKYEGKWEKFADKVYNNSIFTSFYGMETFLQKPKAKVLEKDMMLEVATDLFSVYRGAAEQNAQANDMMAKGNRLFQAGLREMMPNKEFYPDANSTMRASFGNVRSYKPKDGVIYNYYTTLEGVMDKKDPNDDEFKVPEKLTKLYRDKDYGRYADENGNLPVNFIHTNDITGGNSGSPVINGKGELIGLAFDGNWEAMSGDINFEPSVQRTISVDIRYVLFMMDKYAGATNLIDELELVKTSHKEMIKTQPAEKPMKKESAPVESN